MEATDSYNNRDEGLNYRDTPPGITEQDWGDWEDRWKLKQSRDNWMGACVLFIVLFLSVCAACFWLNYAVGMDWDTIHTLQQQIRTGQ